jgi:hypothetical protein
MSFVSARIKREDSGLEPMEVGSINTTEKLENFLVIE